MVIESITSNGDSVQLAPCTKTNGSSFENGEEISDQKSVVFSVNGVREYKRQKHAKAIAEANVIEDGRVELEGGSQLMDKEFANEHVDTVSDGPCTNGKTNVHVFTEPSQPVLHDVILTEKFDILFRLLTENFRGIKVESFSDFNIINSRMRDGSYTYFPKLFIKDLQELGLKFQKTGAEIVSLAKGLSDMSRTLYSEKVGGSVNGICAEGMNQLHLKRTDHLGLEAITQCCSVDTVRHCNQDQADSNQRCVCRCCGGTTNNKICIECDSCKKMYHVFCVGVSVAEDLPKSWHCMNCVCDKLESPHKDCVVCESISKPGTKTHVHEDKRKPNMVNQPSESTSSQSCKLCRCEFNNNKYRECEHSLCHNKFHLRCLSQLELKRFGRRWYCPSCLCRVCLVNQDDEKIVLCDGCDNAYHIYCMEPPLSSVPKGDWFCRVCDTRVQAIHKAKRAYEMHQESGKTETVHQVIKPMDVLLSAVEELEK